MKKTDSEKQEAVQRNEDPITGEPGSHPLSTGLGAAGAGVVGVVIGTAIAGPVGGMVGAAVGGLVGGLGGSAVAESVDPSVTNDSLVGGTASSPVADIFTSPQVTNPDSTLVTSDEISVAPVDRPEVEKVAVEPPVTSHRHEQVEARAWRIYEAEGFPVGREKEHWAQAEREISML